jgi:ribonuclease HII
MGESADGTRLRILAGIDEAGLGPLLGPMTMGYAVFRSRAATANLWDVLEVAVSPTPGDDPKRFVVADSKKVFNRTPRGAKRLEATALGFLALLDAGRAVERSAESLVCARPSELAFPRADFEPHPWFARLPVKLPRHNDAKLLELRVERLARVMKKTEVELVDAGVRVVPERELNRSFRATGNKSRTTWEHCSALIARVWELHAAEGVRCVVDRQGGRAHYGGLLARLFRRANVEMVREEDGVSEYRVSEREGPRRMKILFAEKADRRSFAVALASCLAKYARETAMDAFNDYFGELSPGLAPTAGYTTDGRRWLVDAAEMLERTAIDRRCLVRER